MREDLKEIYHQYLLLNNKQRVEEARVASLCVLTALNDKYPDNPNNARLVLLIIRMCIALDNKVSKEECDLFNALFDTKYSVKELEQFILYEDNGEFDKLDAIVDILPLEIKYDLCLLGLLFLSSDNDLQEEEVVKFEKLLA